MYDIQYRGLFGWEIFDTNNGAPVAFYDNFESAFSHFELLTNERNNVIIAASYKEDNDTLEEAAKVHEIPPT